MNLSVCVGKESYNHPGISWLLSQPLNDLSLMLPTPPPKKQAGLEFPFPLVLLSQTPSCLFACLWGTKTRCDVSSFQAERGLKETLGDCPGMAFRKEGNQMWIIRVMGRILRQLLLLPWVTTIKPQPLSGSHCLTAMAMRIVRLLGPFHRSSDNVDHQGNDKKTIDSILILRVTVARSWTFYYLLLPLPFFKKKKKTGFNM